MRASDHRYTAAIQPLTFQNPTPLTSATPIRLQITVLPTKAVGILRYCMRTFSAAISAARSGCNWHDMAPILHPCFLYAYVMSLYASVAVETRRNSTPPSARDTRADVYSRWFRSTWHNSSNTRKLTNQGSRTKVHLAQRFMARRLID